MEKPHAVFVPYPAQGHVTPMMRLAKLLHSKGVHVTFVNTEFNHRRLMKSKGPEAVKGLSDFKFETIPDGMPPSENEDATQDIPMLCYYTRKTCLEPFKDLLRRLQSAPDGPRVSCVVSDGVVSFGIRAARELGIHGVQFWTASACAFVGYLNYRELVRRGICPFKNDDYLTDGTLDAPIDWIVGLDDKIRLKYLPSFLRTSDPDDIMFEYLGEEAQSCLKSPAIVFNTFEEFERESLQAVKSHFNYANTYKIGPLQLLAKQMPKTEADPLDPSLWRPDPTVFDWLDGQKPGSVVYVNYGSITTMTPRHFQEFAWGLAKSEQPFLWVVRADVVKDESTLMSEEFYAEVEGRGLTVGWCAQDRVLKHGSVGAFLTHCGWNSMLESVCEGVPVICWPFFADQQTNCFYSCNKWGVGAEIGEDVKRDDVARVVRDVMVGEGGREMRIRAKEWRKKAESVAEVGGTSYLDFERFVENEIMNKCGV